MKKTIFGIIVLLTVVISVKANSFFSDDHVYSSWYLEDTTVHYSTEAFANTNYLYASLDPTGGDNSAWFLLVDNQDGQTLGGSFDDIYHEGFVGGIGVTAVRLR